MTFDLNTIRGQFPSLSIEDGDHRRIYFDNPGGTQVPQMVVDRMTECLVEKNANIQGSFKTSNAVDALIEDAHQAVADLLNAPSRDEIVFGQNMTTLTLYMSRSIGRCFKPGDEIVLSCMDHDGNIGPWLLLARDLGLEVRWLPFNTETFEFDLEKLDDILTEKTKLVCVGGASNMTGTINDIKTINAKAHDVGAWTYIDAVQLIPHVSTDVQDLDCDFLVCSSYKYFGPHQGTLWGRREIMERLEPYKVRPASEKIPDCFETGTQNHEGMAGTAAAIDYFAWIGESMAGEYHEQYSHFEGRRKYVHAALDCLFAYERELAEHLINGLQQLPGVRIHGITAVGRDGPTRPDGIFYCRWCVVPIDRGRRWARKTYSSGAATITRWKWRRRWGSLESGAVRIGPVHYNSIRRSRPGIERALGHSSSRSRRLIS